MGIPKYDLIELYNHMGLSYLSLDISEVEVKCVLSELDDIDTLIFDEIDSGVSGRAALKIAAKMKELSKTHQVICCLLYTSSAATTKMKR